MVIQEVAQLPFVLAEILPFDLRCLWTSTLLLMLFVFL